MKKIVIPDQMTCLNPNAPLNGMKVAALEYMLHIK